MNKIITINIGGIAISIEEDAYDVLRDYIKNISNHFANTENGEEIVSDIELRVAEMLQGKLSAEKSKVSINVEDVKDVADTMGYPSDFDADDDQEQAKTKEKTEEKEEAGKTASSQRTYTHRRLFRDMEDKRIGGVCGGLAKYFDIDVTVLRIIWVISVLVFGFGFWIYIILWAVLPEAKTTAEKLQMKGEAPNIENIKNTIEQEAKDVYNRLTTPENRRTVSRFFDRFGQFMVHLLGALFKILAIVIFVAIIVMLIGAVLSIIMRGSFYTFDPGFHISGRSLHLALLSDHLWVLRIAVFLTIALPLLYLGMKILPEIISVPKPSRPVRQGMLSAWLLAIIVAFSSMFYNVYQFREVGQTVKQEVLDVRSDTIIIRVDDLIGKKYKSSGNRVQLDVVQQTGNDLELDVVKYARGRTESNAEEETGNIVDSYKVVGNTLLVSDRVLLKEGDRTRIPQMELTLRLPVGKSVIFHESTRYIIHDIKNLQNVYDPQMAGHLFRMTEAGLKCMDCPDDITENRYGNGKTGTFEKVHIEGVLNVKIVEGQGCRVDIPNNHRLNRDVDMRIENNELYLEQEADIPLTFEWGPEITVYLPNLKGLVVEGAGRVESRLTEIEKPYLDIEIEGAGSAQIHDIHARKVSVKLEGAAQAKLDGKTDLLLLDMEGASQFKSYDLIADVVNADMEGACRAKVYAVKELSGDLSGASGLKYKGNPEKRVDVTAGASVEGKTENE